MANENGAGAVDTCSFGAHELLFVGGDYGTIHLQGATEEARRTLDSVVAAARLRGDRVEFSLVVAVHYDEALVIEDVDAEAAGGEIDGE